MTSHEFEKLLAKYSRGQCTPAEEDFITQWYNAIDSESRNDLPVEVTARMREGAWERLNARVTARRGRPRFRAVYGVAAVVTALVVAGVSAFFLFGDGDAGGLATDALFVTPVGWLVRGNDCSEPCAVLLADGSEVTLQPGSTIRFPEHFAADKREIQLTGEAFFDVHRDTLRPFLVYANEVVTRVLGTSFTITAYTGAKEVTVAVRTGKVSVYKQAAGVDKAEAAVILVPNQQVVYNRINHRVLKALVREPQLVLDKPTLFATEYDETPVVKILEELEMNYGIDISFDDAALDGCMLTTSMADEGLYERIRIICEAIGARYALEGTSIVITSEGCTEK